MVCKSPLSLRQLIHLPATLHFQPSGLLMDRRRKVGRKREVGRAVHPAGCRTGPVTLFRMSVALRVRKPALGAERQTGRKD